MERLETAVLIKYVVREDELDEALAVAERLKCHRAASGVLRDYYAVLPDDREEMIRDLRIVEENRGTYLFAVETTGHHYLYVGSAEESLYIGHYEDGIDDRDILLFFGFKDREEFSRRLPASPADLPPVGRCSVTVCIVCGVTEGELHVLGCPVEECPWCSGQLSRCNCRFDQLGVDEIEDEGLLERFESLLEQKGRIVFRADQTPSYPTAGKGRDPHRD